MNSNAVWIDSNTKQSVKLLADEVTLLVAVLYNTPTVGCYHVQKHVQSRCPKVIEEGRTMGRKLDTVYRGLAKDTQFAVESLETQVLASHEVFKSLEQRTKEWISHYMNTEKRIKEHQQTSRPSSSVADPVISEAPSAVSDSVATVAAETTEVSLDREASSGELKDSLRRQELMAGAVMDDEDVHGVKDGEGA